MIDSGFGGESAVARAEGEDDVIDINRILVPVDFSDPSKAAAHLGLSLALKFGARLMLAHVIPPSSAFAYAFPAESFAFQTEQARTAKSMLRSLIPSQYHDDVDLRTIVKIGDVSRELLSIVSDDKVSVVAMGTHGRSPVERLVLGSLTERMLRKLPVPILTVSRHEDPANPVITDEPIPLNHVLYATDLSDEATRGLRFALQVARRANARLTVLHVLRPAEAMAWGIETGFVGEELRTLRDDTLRRLVATTFAECKFGYSATPVLTEGTPFSEILRAADNSGADLIVLNLHGKGFVERALLGSTAERVIRSARVPVLSIPSAAEPAVQPIEVFVGKEAV